MDSQDDDLDSPLAALPPDPHRSNVHRSNSHHHPSRESMFVNYAVPSGPLPAASSEIMWRASEENLLPFTRPGLKDERKLLRKVADVLVPSRAGRKMTTPDDQEASHVDAQPRSHSVALAVFPPFFDTRLYYRKAHRPYKIWDQENCASCVFISAASVAHVRAGISMDDTANAAEDWRQLIAGLDLGGGAGHGGEWTAVRGEEEGEHKGAAAFLQACIDFSEEMKKKAANGNHYSVLQIPLLDWKRYICCSQSGKECDMKIAAKGDAADKICYHHQDGDPDHAAFTCDKHDDGVVPHHFVEWVSKVGFFDFDGRKVIKKVVPERASRPPNAVSKFIVADQLDTVSSSMGKEVCEQIRSIKASLMNNGPLMVMMRIEATGFDIWPHRLKKQERQEGGGSGNDDDEPRETETNDDEPREDIGKVLRRGYRLDEPGKLDEYHEVMLVGWGRDDLGKPCWIIQNSYGPKFNDSCSVDSKRQTTPFHAQIARVVEDAYHMAGVDQERGCVMVEMVNPELLENDLGSALENNVLGFVPKLSSEFKASRPSSLAGGSMKGGEFQDEFVFHGSSAGEWIATVVVILFAILAVFVALQGKTKTASLLLPV